MAIKAAGASPSLNPPLSFSEIAAEFGYPSGNNLGAYRIKQTVGSLVDMPLDAGIPQSVSAGSSTIRFSNFYSKRLNVVVDFHSGNPEEYRVNARQRYIDNNVTVIRPDGSSISRRTNSSGSKVFVNVNKTVGSNADAVNNVALRTGLWDAGTILQIDVGSSGGISGAGGRGGDANGGDGSSGTSGLGIEYPGTSVVNRGFIQCGFGGGGAGGNGASNPDKSKIDDGYSGGGGGGGAGAPAGGGGNAGDGVYGQGSSGGNGSAGTLRTRGGGGGGGSGRGGSAGGGGAGGDKDNAPLDGGDATGGNDANDGGSAGGNGYAIISSVSVGTNWSFSGNAVNGSNLNSGSIT